MDIIFNTKRLYTAAGQIVRARHDKESNMILFADYSRGCDGVIKGPILGEFTTKRCMAEHVMSRYDRGQYERTPESWHLLMCEERPDFAFAETIQL